MQANSHPITPPPTIRRLPGSVFQCSASSDVQTLPGSSGQPGNRDGTDPVARIVLSAVSCRVLPPAVTASLPAPSSLPVPANSATFLAASSDSTPPRSFATTSSLRF